MSKEQFQNTFEEAKKQIPKRWFENRVIIFGVSMSVYFASSYAYSINHASTEPFFVAAPVATYILGSILDKVSSVKVIEQLKKLEEITGQDYKIGESSVFLPKKPSAKDFYSPKRNIFDYGATAMSVIFPGIGFSGGVSRCLASLNNFRMEKRIRRAIEIAENS